MNFLKNSVKTTPYAFLIKSVMLPSCGIEFANYYIQYVIQPIFFDS